MSGADFSARDPAPAGETPNNVKGFAQAVKLVIWDLDETFWNGTLSEGGVSLEPLHVSVLRELNLRGIVSSICSKNDLDAVQSRLVADDLWDQFVFPSISWEPKGERIAQIIGDAQLRPENVLFIDDLLPNQIEAQHYAPGIQTAGPEVIAGLLEMKELAGKDDSKLSRLLRYKVLERKVADRAATPVSNEEFLRACEIVVELGEDCARESGRLVELINRSNQLNYTKRRLHESQLLAMIADPNCEARYVRVRDRYGDYGICGFYAVCDGTLTDFVFSCRILNMGIENWLYGRLGRPPIVIVPDVATPLEVERSPDWINVADDRITSEVSMQTPALSKRVLLKGGCDLSLVSDFLGGSIETEFTYVGDSGAQVHWEHTEILRGSAKNHLALYGAVIDRLPFLDRSAYTSKALDLGSEPYDVLIYSILMDYTQALYSYRDSDFVVPYGISTRDITRPATWPTLTKGYGRVGLDRPFLKWFSEHFEYKGRLEPERFQENIRWLAQAIPPEARLILLNGSEIAMGHSAEGDISDHHRRMNRALDEVVAELPNAVVCDVRDFVSSRDDVTDNVRHYQRRVYVQLAEALRDLVGDGVDLQRTEGSTGRRVTLEAAQFARRLRQACSQAIRGRGQVSTMARPADVD